jgi:hypothetical protein
VSSRSCLTSSTTLSQLLTYSAVNKSRTWLQMRKFRVLPHVLHFVHCSPFLHCELYLCRYLAPDAQVSSTAEGHSHSCESPRESEFSVSSSKVLIKEQVPSSAAVSAAESVPASKAGKPKRLSFVQEGSPFVEQQGMVSPASASGASAAAGAPVGLEGRQQMGLWMRLIWALTKYRALLWRELLITTRWVCASMCCCYAAVAVVRCYAQGSVRSEMQQHVDSSC